MNYPSENLFLLVRKLIVIPRSNYFAKNFSSMIAKKLVVVTGVNKSTRSILLLKLKRNQTCFCLYPGWCKTSIVTQDVPMTSEQEALGTLTVLDFDRETSKQNATKLIDKKKNFYIVLVGAYLLVIAMWYYKNKLVKHTDITKLYL